MSDQENVCRRNHAVVIVISDFAAIIRRVTSNNTIVQTHIQEVLGFP
jgi:hypothetical protein